MQLKVDTEIDEERTEINFLHTGYGYLRLYHGLENLT